MYFPRREASDKRTKRTSVRKPRLLAAMETGFVCFTFTIRRNIRYTQKELMNHSILTQKRSERHAQK
ncbi:hypothetical protein J2X83_003585 [Brevibacillus nitrificans]|nr:hypothetical protein [Brevibacillus nitrificans]